MEGGRVTCVLFVWRGGGGMAGTPGLSNLRAVGCKEYVDLHNPQV